MARRFFVWGAVLALLADQVSKVMVHGALDVGDSMLVIPGVLRLVHTGNPDGVFGLSFGPRFLYYIMPALGAAVVTWLGLRVRDRWSAAAFGLLLGGAVGNLADRVRLGHVIDFIDMGWRGWHWFTYNVADVALVAGIVMLLVRELLWRKGSECAAPGTSVRPTSANN